MTRCVLLALALLAAAPLVAAQSLPAWANPSAEDAEAERPVEAPAPMARMMPPSTPGGPAAPVPLDGGLSLLLLAGAGLGARRLRQS